MISADPESIDHSPRYFTIHGKDAHRGWMLRDGHHVPAHPGEFHNSTVAGYRHYYPITDHTDPALETVADSCDDLNQPIYDAVLLQAKGLADDYAALWQMDVDLYDADGDIVYQARFEAKP